jgi:glucose/arabinose dehydrogenase
MRYPLVLLLPVGIIAASLGWTDSTPSESPAPEAYTRWCSSCHGPEGRDFVDRDWKLGSTADAVRRVIEEGHELLGMPAYGSTLSAGEIDAITDFVMEQAASARGFKPTPPEQLETSDLTLRVNTMVNGLETPWGMDFVNDTTLLITEREGRLWKLEAGRLVAIDGLPDDIHVKGQGGLLDVMHWQDRTTGEEWVYLTYSKDRPGDADQSATALVRAPWSAETERIDAWEELFVATPYEKTHHHYGSRVEIAGDGKLYLTCGERGRRDVHPQTLTTSPGKVHRFNPDGSIPEDNPFVNQPDAVPSIWSWGHRNPQGMFCHPETGTIWTHEHGPKGGDEINIPEPGNNYGWPKITFGRNYIGTIITKDTAMAGMEQPLYYWLPSIGACGMDVVYGDSWPESWQNNLLVGSLSFEYLERLQFENNRVVGRERLLEGVGRVRDIARNSKGEVFVAVEGAGTVLHLEPMEIK